MDGWIGNPGSKKVQFSSSFKVEILNLFSFGTFQNLKQKYSVRNSPYRYIHYILM